MNSEMSRPGNGRARFSGGSFARRLLPAACIAAALTPALVEAAVIFPLSYPADNQYSVDLPYSVSYPAHGNASVTGQGIEQLLIRGWVRDAHVVFRFHQAAAEEMLPVPIHQCRREELVVRRGHPVD